MNSSEKFNQELDDLLKRDYINEDSEFFDELKLARDIKNLQNPNNKVEKEIYNNMKNKKSKKPLKIAAVAACLIIALPITTNAGQELYTRIKQAILPSGRVVVNEEKPNFDPSQDQEVPEGYKGHVFDKNGKALEKMNQYTRLYDKDGNEITAITYDEGSKKYSFYTEKDVEEEDKKYTFYDDQEKIADEKLNFKPLLLPEKYNYQKAYVYSQAGEKSDYANFTYKDSKNREIILFESVSSKEAAYETGGSDVKEINIDGVDIIFHDGDTFEFEKDGLLITLLCRNMTYEEIKEVYKDIYLYK